MTTKRYSAAWLVAIALALQSPAAVQAQQIKQLAIATFGTGVNDTSYFSLTDSLNRFRRVSLLQMRKALSAGARFDSVSTTKLDLISATVTGTPTWSSVQTFATGQRVDSATGAARAQVLTTSRNLWGVAFTGAANVTSAPTFTAGATVSSGQTLTLTGATITGFTAASVGTGAFPSGTYTFTGTTGLTGGAGSWTQTAGTGASRQMAFQTTTSGSTATTFLRGNELQQSLFASGAVGTPGATFAADSIIGFYRIGTAGANDTIGVAINGVAQAFFTSTGNASKGVATTSNAAAGFIGEYLSGARATGVSLTLATGTPLTVDSVSLTAGDWDVSGTVSYTFASTTSYTNLVGCVSTTTNSVTTGAPQGSCFDYETSAIIPTATADQTWVVPVTRISISSTTVVFITSNQVFSAAALKGYGTIRARRVR